MTHDIKILNKKCVPKKKKKRERGTSVLINQLYILCYDFTCLSTQVTVGYDIITLLEM